jgi:4-azaleucine resistance transporter AzlC
MKNIPLLKAAIIYSIPVLLGYLAIGAAFGLLITDTGYPWYLALLMSVWMYAGAGQYIAVGLFVTGTTIWEACLIQLVVNARHIAYGLSMINRFPKGAAKPYLVFSLTDETFALLSSLPPGEGKNIPPPGKERDRFTFYVSLFNQCYWIVGTITGAILGSLLPFNMEGIGFALTALFIVLFWEQIFNVFRISKNPEGDGASNPRYGFSFGKLGIFVFSAAAALVSVILLPERISLLAGMILALILASFFEIFPGKKGEKP